MSKQEQRQGKQGQQVAHSVLHALGVECLEEIATPVITIPVGKAKNPRDQLYKIRRGEKVSADHHGILPDGTGVLIEVKTFEHNLVWSNFRPHQPPALTEWAKFGLALVVWVCAPDVYVMRWPIPGLEPGRGITPTQGAVIDYNTRQWLAGRVNFRDVVRNSPEWGVPQLRGDDFDQSCQFCHAWRSAGHRPGCAWVEAQK